LLQIAPTAREATKIWERTERMKQEIVFKRAFNDALDLVQTIRAGELLPSENVLGRELGVSRTTVRKVLGALVQRGVLRSSESGFETTGRRTRKFPKAETVSTSEQVERKFMEWMLRDNASPGTMVSEIELARQFGVATSSIREFLNRFRRFGLLDKRPNSGWVFVGFTEAFALELFEIREMFEIRSALAFAKLPNTSPLWREIEDLRQEHLALLDDIDSRFHDFSDLDSRFHRLIHSASSNRFIDGFQDIITLIFHYHYQWNKQDERERNEHAVREHLTYIDALQGRNKSIIDLACRAHLTSARETLLRSIRA
jgi:DNA-binding GntR family transcriptional regulator